MAIDYSAYLTNEQKRQILSARIQQFAADAYQNSLNAQVAAASGDTATQQQAEANLAVLDTAITVHQQELDALPVETVTPDA